MTELTTVRPTLPSSRQLLARVLDERELVAAIQHLTPPALARLIDHVGLEDAGELIALATTDQLARVFDEDLWRRGRPGEDETFDAARFVVWLEVMLEAGAAFTADRLAELPEDLVVHAFHQQLLVIDLDALGVEVSGLGEDGDELEKALDGCLYHELDVYRLIARRHDGWDAIVTVLVALDEDHHDLLIRVLERCCALSSRAIDDGGQAAIRLGLRQIAGLSEAVGKRIVAARQQRAFLDVRDLSLRAGLDEKSRSALAEAGALQPLAGHRHAARWAVAGIERQRPGLPTSGLPPATASSGSDPPRSFEPPQTAAA